MDTLARRASMRGTAPPSGTSEGFRDTMIFGYIDHTGGARANSSECLACMWMGSLRCETVDDDVQLAVLADMITNLSERVAARGRRCPAQRNTRHHVELLAGGDATRGHHCIRGGQLDVDRELRRQALGGEWWTRRAWIPGCNEQRGTRRHFRREIRRQRHVHGDLRVARCRTCVRSRPARQP